MASEQHFVPHTPLQWEQVLSPVNLDVPGRTQEKPVLAQWRLNLVAAHGDRLYLSVETDAIYEYVITRTNGISLEPRSIHPVTPSTAVNNVKFVVFDHNYGGPTLLLAGGDAAVDDAPASLSVMRIGKTVVNTYYLNNFTSAWGLHADPNTGRVALSTNSHATVILQLSADDVAPQLATPPIHSTHSSNIPCVVFSPCGKYVSPTSLCSH